MKKAQKLLSVVLAVMLVLATAIPALAADDGSIIISGSTNVSVAGKTFKAYKILDAVFVDEADTGKGVAYLVPDALKAFYASEFELDSTKANFNAEVVTAIRALSADELSDFADDALAAAKAAGVEAKQSTAGEAATTVTISNLALGYYVIEDATENANGKNTAISSVMLDTTDKTAEVTIKADVPSIDKNIDGDNDTDMSATGLVKNNNAAIGDKVPFVLTSKVPSNMDAYSTYTYKVTDILSNGLTFNNDVVVTVDSETLVEEDYTVSVSGQTVTINFTNIKSYEAGADIKIEYSATVDTDAVIGTAGNDNTVYLEYSNNPQDTSSNGKTPDSVTRTYVTGVSLVKVDAKDNEKTLAGATFTITGTKLNTVIVTDANGEDTIITKAEDVVYSGTSGENGLITFEGLAAGTYTITEIVAPEGYNILPEPVDVTINWTAPADGATECTWSVDAEEGSTATVEDGVVVFTIENSTGSLLPDTGGIGTTIFYIVGALLVVGAVVLLVSKKRAASK